MLEIEKSDLLTIQLNNYILKVKLLIFRNNINNDLFYKKIYLYFYFLYLSYYINERLKIFSEKKKNKVKIIIYIYI